MTLNLSEYDPATVGSGGLPKPGKCHLIVSEIDLEHLEDGYLSVVHEIVAHDDPSQVGKTSYNSFQTNGKGAARLQAFLEVTGVLTRQDFIDAKAAGDTEIEPNYKAAVGQTYFGDLVAGKYNGKPTCKVEWVFWAPDAPEADDYPRNLDYVPKSPNRGDDETETPDDKDNVKDNNKDDVPF